MIKVMNSFLSTIDKYINPLIWCSIVCLFIELSQGKANSLEDGMWIFLWIERVTAVVFLIEYCCRIKCAKDGRLGYIFSPFGFIDLLSFLPFFVGFIVPLEFLGWIRALRILRLLKRFRYDRRMQLFALAIYKGWWMIKTIFGVSIFFSLLASVLLYEAEKSVQPETFGNIFNILFYFCPIAGSTIGFGDMYPVTTMGKICTIGILVFPLIGVTGALLGIISSQFEEIIKLEKDNDQNILEKFR